MVDLGSGCQMIQYLNGGLKTGLKKACLWSKISGIQMVHQVTGLYHLNTGHPYCLVFRCLVFRWLLYLKDCYLLFKLALVKWEARLVLKSRNKSVFKLLSAAILKVESAIRNLNFYFVNLEVTYFTVWQVWTEEFEPFQTETHLLLKMLQIVLKLYML